MKGEIHRSIKSNFIYNALFQILMLIVPLITTPYISRVLGAENIGIQSYTGSIVSYFVLFATFGLNMYGQREIAYHSSSVQDRSRVFWEVALNKFVFALLIGFTYIVFVYHANEYKEVLVWQGLNILACALDISWYFQGVQDFKRIVIRNTIVKVIGIVCIFSFIHTADDLILYVILLGSTTLIGNVVLWGYMSKELVKVSWHELCIFRDVRIKLELFAPFIAIQIYTVLDKTMIGIFTGDPAQNGYYEQSQKIVQMSLAIITSLGTVLLPNISAKFAQRDLAGIREIIMKAYHIAILCACPMTCGLIAISPVFVPWFLGAGYEDVIFLLQIFSLLFIFISLSNLAGMGILTPTNKQNYGTLAVVFGALVNLILNINFIKLYGAIGAAVSSIIAEFIVAIVHLYYIRLYVDLKIMLLWICKYMYMSIAVAGVELIIGNLLVIGGIIPVIITLIQIVIGLMMYLSLLYIFDRKILYASS